MSEAASSSAVLADEEATLAFGARLAQAMNRGLIVYLHGELGVGKTTLVRGLLQALGLNGPVKSPTYTLVEPYRCAGLQAYHLDLYRLTDPEELDYIGVRDFFAEDALCLVEWPERGTGFLPEADIVVRLEYSPAGRRVHLVASSARGEAALSGFRIP